MTTKNFETLKELILSSSVSDIFTDAIKEWDYNEIFRKPGSSCACGKTPITNVCVLENNQTGKIIQVGNECVHHFDMDFSLSFEQLKQEEKRNVNLDKYKGQIAKLKRMMEGASEWEVTFLKSIVGCYANDWKISPKQQEILNRLVKNYHGIATPEVDHKLKILAKCKNVSEWEGGFLDSIIQQVKLGREISEKQNIYVLRILKKNGLNLADLKVPKESQTKYTPQDFKSLEPRAWQVDAYNKWVLMDEKATIEAGTGIGKTKFALMSLEKNPDKTFLIVVPTEYLQLQWEKEIKSMFGDQFQIGKIGGGFSEGSKQVTIAIVNSIRNKDMSRDIGIFDEFHRYGSIKNISFLEESSFEKMIGLSATVERPDNAHIELLEKCPICYTITQKEGIDEKYLCPYQIINEEVYFSEEEEIEYRQAEATVKSLFPLFQYNYAQMQSYMMAGHSDAKDLNRAFNARKRILNNAKNKIPKVLQLINKHKNGQYPKTIIFSELKTTANKIYSLLKKNGIPVGIYHSGLKTKERMEMMEKFASDEFRVMVSVKALDEGIDVPNIELGILVAGNSVERQWIQRVGRILRAAEGKVATMYQLYIPDSQDEVWAKKRLKGVEKGIPIFWGTHSPQHSLEAY